MNGVELAKGFLEFLKTLKEHRELGDWKFIGPTDIAYPTPIGAWTETGFLFRKTDDSVSFILRSIARLQEDKIKLVIESINLKGQLYNIDLKQQKAHKSIVGRSIIFESFDMTIGRGRRPRIEVQRAFEDLGVNTNVISELNDDSPDWEKFTKDILNWGELRERVKINLKDSHVSPNVPEETKIVMNQTNKISDFPLNQILYGPPGTGKTYTTIAKAVGIIDGLSDDDLANKSRQELKNRFEQLKSDGQIVFCTFHQSMSYEDFIEGIKPILNEEETEGNLSYRIEDGIFKQLCVKAQYQFYSVFAPDQKQEISRAELFNLAYNELISDIEEKLDSDQVVQLISVTGLKLFVTRVSDLLNLKIKHDGDVRERPYIVSRPRLLKLFTHFNSVDDIRNIHKDIRAVIGGANTTAYWAVLSELYKTAEKVKSVSPADQGTVDSNLAYETIKLLNANTPVGKQGDASQKFVLIIDEINRGNVSQIFGELISLIEDDKRLGAREALEATLPYSKEKFGVPQNLYIIGTMNTADRSVEALDTALRRRFSFEEITPKPFLLENMEMDGLSFELILETINIRIEKLLDRDHQIGHSYFLSVKNLDDLKAVFRNKINPLLQEYFFGDYGKIGLILGSGFVSLDKQGTENLFADFAYPDDYSILEKPVYRLKDISQMDDSAFKEAVRILLNSAIA
jgi:5-methylcytosine-specific restriction protein B